MEGNSNVPSSTNFSNSSKRRRSFDSNADLDLGSLGIPDFGNSSNKYL